MFPRIFHTVNSALYFQLDESVLFIDALHAGRDFHMSDTPHAVLEETEKPHGAFSFDTALLFTHLHADHYDKELTGRFLARHPGTRLLSPEERRNWEGRTPEEGVFRFEHGPFTVHAFATTHQGGQIMQIPHFCYLIEAGAVSYLVCGDARLSEETVEKIKRYTRGLEAVFLNVYHLNTEKEQRLIRLLAPKRCIIIHLPLPGEDTKGYRAMAREAVESIQGVGRLEMPSPMSRLTSVR